MGLARLALLDVTGGLFLVLAVPELRARRTTVSGPARSEASSSKCFNQRLICFEVLQKVHGMHGMHHLAFQIPGLHEHVFSFFFSVLGLMGQKWIRVVVVVVVFFFFFRF